MLNEATHWLFGQASLPHPPLSPPIGNGTDGADMALPYGVTALGDARQEEDGLLDGRGEDLLPVQALMIWLMRGRETWGSRAGSG